MIYIENITEYSDGSSDITLNIGAAELMVFAEIGLLKVLKDAAKGEDPITEEKGDEFWEEFTHDIALAQLKNRRLDETDQLVRWRLSKQIELLEECLSRTGE